MKFLLTLNLEMVQSDNLSSILDCVEIGEFKTQQEAQEALDAILEMADLEPEEVDEPE